MFKVIKRSIIFFMATIFLIIISVLTYGLYLEFTEEAPVHHLNFSEKRDIKLNNDIDNLNAGYKYALSEALNYRDDVYLSYVVIRLNGINDILDIKGDIIYRFGFPYIDENKPAGTIAVSLNNKSNKIDFISTNHVDSEVKYDELDLSNLEKFDKIYDTTIKAFEKNELKKYEKPFIMITIENYNAKSVFYSSEEEFEIVKSIMIDMNTYEWNND
jgi:hypothetical protein